MKQKLFFLLLLTVLGAVPLFGQQRLKFSVADFSQDPMDLTARNDQHKRMDDNGVLYSIIKVKSDIPGDKLRDFHFDFGYMNSFEEWKDDLDELWVYVQKNAKRVTITREGYTTVSKYDLGLTIGAGNTYVMLLTVQAPVVQYRIVQFKVNPADEGALVKVRREDAEGDYELWGAVDGTGSIDRRLELGTYLYEVAAENYEPSEGRIVLTGGEGNYVEAVTLRPNFGWLEIDDANGIAGADIYVDNKKIGKVPYTAKTKWPVRDGYRLMISAGEMYKTYNSTFDIRKGEVTHLSPQLESDFAKTTLRVEGDAQADIYIEGSRRGTGTWTGPLKAGAYTVECRKAGHRPTSTQVVVKSNQEETFVLTAPQPITGSVYVTSQPSGARVFLDGEGRGQTPMELKDVIIGRHEVKVALDNYKAEQQTVTVEEGRSSEVRFTLRDFAKFTITSTPSGANLKVNGKYQGSTPCGFEGASGEYDLQLTKTGYQPYHKRVQLNSSSPSLAVRLGRQYMKPTNYYAQASFQAGNLMGASAHMGAYFNNFNVEAYGLLGLSKESLYINSIYGIDSHEVELGATAFGAKVGYGIIVGNRLRFTPQVGAGGLYVSVSGHYVTNDYCNLDVQGGAICATVGCRVDYAITSFFGINLTPEAQFAVVKRDTFSRLADASSTINGWASGVGARLGLYFYF